MDSLAPGWYTSDEGERRYWTGTEWIEEVSMNAPDEKTQSTAGADALEASAEEPYTTNSDTHDKVPSGFKGAPKSHASPKSKMIILVVLGVIALVALLVAGLFFLLGGKSAKPSIEAGWARTIDRRVAFLSEDYEINYMTEELERVSAETLSMPGQEVVSLSELRTEAEQYECEHVISYSDGDLDRSRVFLLMLDVWGEARLRIPDSSPELQEAQSTVGERVSSTLPEQPAVDKPGFEDWQAEFRSKSDAEFAKDFPHLVAERESQTRLWEDIRASIFNEEMVLDVQKFLIKKCGISVPEGYTFRTAAELDIELDR